MKKQLIFTLAILIGMASCGRSGKLEKEAKNSVQELFTDLAKDPSSVKLSNVETVYKSDSLCILHLQLTAKNGLGIESTSGYEYVYITSGDNKYEAYQEKSPGNDIIYQDEETYDRTKGKKIYKELSYDDGMYYKAAILANSLGRAVGDKAGEINVNIPVPTGTGSWKFGQYLDEFGEETNNSYIYVNGKGYFSNSATTGSRASACLIYDSKGIHLMFIEYDDHIVKGEGDFDVRVKDSDGDVSTYSFYNSESGRIDLNYGENSFETILKKGGKIMLSASVGKYSKSEYLFKMDVSGFEKALEFITVNNPYNYEWKIKNDDFMKSVSQRKGVLSLGDGIYYTVEREGKGKVPTENDVVKVHYEGQLIDGTSFDSSYKRNEPLSIRPTQVINGWNKALVTMPVGSKWTVYIPSEQAYGSRDMGTIRPFSALIFTIELLSVE